MKILVINAGSSSLKYQLIDMENESLLAKGLCERIGIDGRLTHKPQNGKPVYEADVPFPTHKEAIEAVLEKLTSKEYGVVETMAEIGAVGHRVLHGGIEFTESCVVDDACEAAIKKCFPLGPLHNPANLMGIKACQAAMPGVPQVAVFDTSFGMSMTPEAYIYAIPYEYYENDSIRRYGFHGTSHRFVSARACEIMGKKGTRVNKKSGVLGISGVGSDFRDLEKAAKEGNKRAQLALDKFAYEVRKYIGSYAAAMGGVDIITFTAGVGENGPDMRESICEGLGFLGVHVDHEKNQVRGKETDISAADSTVKVYVIPTNEELMIARDTLALVTK